ncbi:MAG: hypothetical protein AB7P50_11170 [Alphaproteobacteria bacterium]
MTKVMRRFARRNVPTAELPLFSSAANLGPVIAEDYATRWIRRRRPDLPVHRARLIAELAGLGDAR